MKNVVMVSVLMVASISQARYVPHVDFAEFLKESDVVVIAKPITNEASHVAASLESYPAIEVTTTFSVELVLKGPAELEQVQVFHYDLNWAEVERLVNPPWIAEFPVGDLSNHSYVAYSYLLFLKRDSEERLIPLLGPSRAGYSIFMLQPQERTAMEKSRREWKKESTVPSKATPSAPSDVR